MEEVICVFSHIRPSNGCPNYDLYLPKGETRMKATLCRFVRVLVGAVLLTSLCLLLSETAIFNVHAAARVEGCGTGSNYSTTITEYSKGGGKYRVYQDTCQATSVVTTFRDKANDQTYCTATAATIGTISTFFFGTALVAPAGIIAISAFLIAGGCTALAAFYTGIANQLQAANQACGTQGITYFMDASQSFLRISSFSCQSADDSSSDLGLGTVYASLTDDTSNYA